MIKILFNAETGKITSVNRSDEQMLIVETLPTDIDNFASGKYYVADGELKENLEWQKPITIVFKGEEILGIDIPNREEEEILITQVYPKDIFTNFANYKIVNGVIE